MFDDLAIAPPDPILGLEEAFKNDPNPAKINLTAGVYRDETGNTPIFRAVKQAEAEILESEITKSYLGITGAPDFTAAVQGLIFGPGSPVLAAGRAITAHAPGGTGALRVAADFVRKANEHATVWISQPTWPNHPSMMKAVGLAVQTYPYFDAAGNRVDFDAMMARLREVKPNDIVLLHGCCHNPTGADLAIGQWQEVAALLEQRGAVPLIDFAYQGFGRGLDEDAQGVRLLAEQLPEVLIASSYSKNFGLYNERVGALTVISRDAAVAQAALSQVKTTIRAIYSSPPAHGAKIVTTILGSPELHAGGRGAHRSALPHPGDAPAVRRGAARGRQRPRFLLHHRAERHVLVHGADEGAGAPPARRTLHLHGRLGPHECGGADADEPALVCEAIAAVL